MRPRGNSGPQDNTVTYPAKYNEVIAVSATDSKDTLADWSSRGPEVELAAAGVGIYSTFTGGAYKTLSGTSMASLHAAGAAALVIASGVANANGDGRINAFVEEMSRDLSPLRKELVSAINKAIGGDYVRAVYLEEFVMQ